MLIPNISMLACNLGEEKNHNILMLEKDGARLEEFDEIKSKVMKKKVMNLFKNSYSDVNFDQPTLKVSED